MIPVEEGKTSSKMQPKLSAAATQVATQPSMPGAPLAQLALPELTSTAATRPPVAARCRRPTVTGAATTRLVVNMAAPTAALSACAAHDCNCQVQIAAGLDSRAHRSPLEPGRQRGRRQLRIVVHSFTLPSRDGPDHRCGGRRQFRCCSWHNAQSGLAGRNQMAYLGSNSTGVHRGHSEEADGAGPDLRAAAVRATRGLKVASGKRRTGRTRK